MPFPKFSAAAPLHVLLVDDDVVDRELVQRRLKAEPAMLHVATSLDEATQVLAGQPIQLILLDYFLPPYEGPQSLELLRGLNSTVPLIFLSGQTDESRAIDALALGASDFLSKVSIDAPGSLWKAMLQAVYLANAKQKLAVKVQEEARVGERLLGIVSHDLRNPLAAIQQALWLLKNTGQLDEKQLRYVTLATGSSQRMSAMIEQLLDFTRIRLGGGWVLSPQNGDLATLASSVVEELKLAWPGRAISLTGESRVMVSFDSNRLWQVLANLVNNALTHGEGTPVVLSVGSSPSEASVEVQNGGPAIPADTLDRLFDPFWRGNRVSSQRGLGLGLYIARELVRQHGGRLDATSAAESGTIFRVSLPRVSA